MKMKKLAMQFALALSMLAGGILNGATILDYSGAPNPGLSFTLNGGVLSAALQPATLNWDLVPQADGPGYIKYGDVALTGPVSTLGAGIYGSSTAGGFLEAYDLGLNLLLRLDFTSGYLTLTNFGTGGSFTTGTATFSGPLATALDPASGTHSASFVNFSPVNVVGGQFADGSGQGNGVVTGDAAVPEPGTFVLLGGGCIALALFRRRKANNNG